MVAKQLRKVHQNLTKQHKKLKYFKRQIHKWHRTTNDPTLQLEITTEPRRPGVARSLPERSTKKGNFYSHITTVLNPVDNECTDLRCQFCVYSLWKPGNGESWNTEDTYVCSVQPACPHSVQCPSALLGDASPTRPSAGPLQPTASIRAIRFMLFLWCCRPLLFLLDCKSSTSDWSRTFYGCVHGLSFSF